MEWLENGSFRRTLEPWWNGSRTGEFSKGRMGHGPVFPTKKNKRRAGKRRRTSSTTGRRKGYVRSFAGGAETTKGLVPKNKAKERTLSEQSQETGLRNLPRSLSLSSKQYLVAVGALILGCLSSDIRVSLSGSLSSSGFSAFVSVGNIIARTPTPWKILIHQNTISVSDFPWLQITIAGCLSVCDHFFSFSFSFSHLLFGLGGWLQKLMVKLMSWESISRGFFI